VRANDLSFGDTRVTSTRPKYQRQRQRRSILRLLQSSTHCRHIGDKWEETVKIQYALPLAVAMGLGFGAVAIRGLHARTTTPPVYVVVEIDEIIDANGFEALRQTADATAVEVQSEDGRYFARTENVTALDGSAPKFFAFIAFDNMTKAKTFTDSMKDTTALRTRVTKSRSFIVEGTSQSR
jgi:uncharacterized protein (DUF1330 family)